MDLIAADNGKPALAVLTSNKGVPSVSLMTFVRA